MKHINNRSTAKAAIFLRTFCLSLLLIGFSSSVFAATYTWDGGGDGSNWSDPANWDSTGVDPVGYPGQFNGPHNITISTGNSTVDAGFSPGSFDISNVTISGGTVTMGKSLALIGSFDLQSGGVFNVGTYELNVGGNITLSGTFSASNGTLVHNSGGTRTITINNSFTLDSLCVKSASGTNSSTLSGSTYSLTVNKFEKYDASFSIASGTTLNITNLFNITSSSGSVSNSGTLSYQSGSELVYKASLTTGDEWPTSGNVPQNVKVDNSATVTLNESKSIAKNFNMSSGTLAMGSNGLTILGTVSGSDIQGGSTVTGTGGFVIGNGSGAQFDQTITGNITLPNATINKNHTNNNLGISGNVTVNNGDFVVTYGNVTVTGVLTVSGSNSLVVNNTSTFSNNNSTKVSSGTLQLSGSSTFQNGTGSTAFDAQTITLTGSATYKTGGKAAAALTTLNLSSTSIFEFNGNGGQENTPLSAGATYGNLTVNNVNGINVVGDVVINGTLTFAIDNGLVDVTSGNTLTLSTTAGVANASSSRFVDGPLQVEFNDATSKIIPIGKSSYRPVVFQYTSNPGATQTIKMEYFEADPGFAATGDISFISDQCFYTLQRVSGSATTTYNLTLTYTDVLVDSQFDPEERTTVLVQNGATSTSYDPATSQDHNIGIDSVTAFGISLPTNSYIIALGAGGTTNQWTGSSSTVWALAGNWSAGIPNDADVVVISGSITNQPVIGTSTTAYAKNISISGANTLEIQGVLDITDNTGAPFVLGSGSTLIVNKSSGDPIKFGGGSGSYNSDRTDFQSGSIVEYQTGTIQNDVYANLNINGSTAAGTTVEVTEDLTVNSDLASGTITLNGSSSQSIYGANSLYNLTINNSTGVSIASGATPTIDGTLTLTNGILNTATGTSLALSKSTSGGSSTSYISGPVLANLTGTTLLEIATGDNAVQRSIALKNSVSGSTSYQVQFIEGEHPDAYNITGPTVLAVSKLYYWSVERLTGSVAADLTLNWEAPGDGISNPAAIMIARYESGWADQGSGTGSGTSVTSPLSVFAQRYYTLGSTNIVDNPLPVELVSFEGLSTNNGITLNWETASEKDSRGFILSRKMSGSSEWEVASTYAGNSALESTNSLTGSKYSVTDYIEIAAGETVQYQLEEEDIAGIRTVLETITVESQYNTTIESYNLAQNYPNPFNPSTTIGYELKDNARVNIVVYNALGQAVKTLVNENQNRGRYSVQFNAGGLSSGIYFYRMIVSGNNVNYTDVRKMMLVK